MLGKLIGRAVGLPFRAAAIPVKLAEMAMDELCGEDSDHVSDRFVDAVRSVEDEIEEVVDE